MIARQPLRLAARVALPLLVLASAAPGRPDGEVASAAFAPVVQFESGPVNALLLAPDGRELYALNTSDQRVEVYGVALAPAAGRAPTTAGAAGKLPGPGGPLLPGAGSPPGAAAQHVSLTWLGSIFTGLEPVAMALDPADPRRMFVSNHVSDSVSVVDLDLRQVVATIDVGDEPQGLLVTGGRLFVACARAPEAPLEPGQVAPGPLVEHVVAVHVADFPFARVALLPLGAVKPRDLVLAGGLVHVIPQNSGNRTTLLDETQATLLGLSQLVTDAFDAPLVLNAVLAKPELVWPAYTRGWTIPVAGRIVLGDEHPTLVPQLADRDVSAIDPGQPAVLRPALTGVGTTLFDVERNPSTGALWVANTQARNRVRFEPVLRGDTHEHRVSIVQPGVGLVQVLALEPPLTARVHSQPAVLAFGDGPGGPYAAVACLGSASVVVLDAVTAQVRAELDVGEVPAGLAADSARGLLYVLARGTPAVRAWRAGNWTPAGPAVPLPYDPEPAAVRAGRLHVYDARSSTGHGSDATACGTCHVFAHDDQLAWDLGNPGGSLAYYFPDVMTDLAGFPGQIVTLPSTPVLNPLKGPMVTQSLRGLLDPDARDDLPAHWRGDRRTLHMFAGAFAGLNGAAAPLPRAAMQELQAFLRALRYAPNPREPRDRVYAGQLATGRDLYGLDPDVPGKEYVAGSGFLCAKCHKAEFTGETDFTGSRPTVSAGSFTQLFNTAHLRMIYEKDYRDVSGFGALHDGAVDGVRGFMDFVVPNGGLPTFSNFSVADKDAVAEFVKAFDSGLHPLVGAQWTLSPEALLAPGGTAAADAALSLLEAAARPTLGGVSPGGPVTDDLLPDLDLVIRGWRLDGTGQLLPRGAHYRQDPLGSGAWGYLFDTGAFVDRALLELVVATGAATFTFTAVPPGQGERLGLDRDEDGLFDWAETLAGTSPVLPDSDGDGWLDGAEGALGGNPLQPDGVLPDVTPPDVLGARVVDLFADAGTLSCRTSEPADVLVEVGDSPTDFSLLAQAGPVGLRRTHDVVLTGLPAGVPLFARVTATDRAGLATAVTVAFNTLPRMFHVQDITLDKSGSPAVVLQARVLILDHADAPAPAGVPVRAFWAGDLGGQAWEQEAFTDATGWATFDLAPYVPAAPGTVTFSPVYVGSPFPAKAWFVGFGGDTPGHFYDQAANRAHYRDVSVP